MSIELIICLVLGTDDENDDLAIFEAQSRNVLELYGHAEEVLTHLRGVELHSEWPNKAAVF